MGFPDKAEGEGRATGGVRPARERDDLTPSPGGIHWLWRTSPYSLRPRGMMTIDGHAESVSGEGTEVSGVPVDLDIAENGPVRFRLRTTCERLAELNLRLAEDAAYHRSFWENPIECLAAYGIAADPIVFAKGA